MNKHTEGPWYVGEEKDGATSIDSQGWDSLALVYTQLDGEPNPEGKWNAAIIAHAPEMYRLLSALRGINAIAAAVEHLLSEIEEAAK
jgi:hypothetical protein